MANKCWCDKCGKEFEAGKERPAVWIHESRYTTVHLCRVCAKGYKRLFRAWRDDKAEKGKDGR